MTNYRDTLDKLYESLNSAPADLSAFTPTMERAASPGYNPLVPASAKAVRPEPEEIRVAEMRRRQTEQVQKNVEQDIAGKVPTAIPLLPSQRYGTKAAAAGQSWTKVAIDDLKSRGLTDEEATANLQAQIDRYNEAVKAEKEATFSEGRTAEAGALAATAGLFSPAVQTARTLTKHVTAPPVWALEKFTGLFAPEASARIGELHDRLKIPTEMEEYYRQYANQFVNKIEKENGTGMANLARGVMVTSDFASNYATMIGTSSLLFKALPTLLSKSNNPIAKKLLAGLETAVGGGKQTVDRMNSLDYIRRNWGKFDEVRKSATQMALQKMLTSESNDPAEIMKEGWLAFMFSATTWAAGVLARGTTDKVKPEMIRDAARFMWDVALNVGIETLAADQWGANGEVVRMAKEAAVADGKSEEEWFSWKYLLQTPALANILGDVFGSIGAFGSTKQGKMNESLAQAKIQAPQSYEETVKRFADKDGVVDEKKFREFMFSEEGGAEFAGMATGEKLSKIQAEEAEVQKAQEATQGEQEAASKLASDIGAALKAGDQEGASALVKDYIVTKMESDPEAVKEDEALTLIYEGANEAGKADLLGARIAKEAGYPSLEKMIAETSATKGVESNVKSDVTRAAKALGITNKMAAGEKLEDYVKRVASGLEAEAAVVERETTAQAVARKQAEAAAAPVEGAKKTRTASLTQEQREAEYSKEAEAAGWELGTKRKHSSKDIVKATKELNAVITEGVLDSDRARKAYVAMEKIDTADSTEVMKQELVDKMDAIRAANFEKDANGEDRANAWGLQVKEGDVITNKADGRAAKVTRVTFTQGGAWKVEAEVQGESGLKGTTVTINQKSRAERWESMDAAKAIREKAKALYNDPAYAKTKKQPGKKTLGDVMIELKKAGFAVDADYAKGILRDAGLSVDQNGMVYKSEPGTDSPGKAIENATRPEDTADFAQRDDAEKYLKDMYKSGKTTITQAENDEMQRMIGIRLSSGTESASAKAEKAAFDAWEKTVTVEGAKAGPGNTPEEVLAFAKRVAGGERMESPEDVQFYQNNAKGIEAELVKLQKASAKPTASVKEEDGAPSAEVITGEAFRKNITASGGKLDEAGDVFVIGPVSKALSEGRKVTLYADGKPIDIVSITRGMLSDAKGQRWGLMLLATDVTGKTRIEISSATKPDATNKPPAPTRAEEPASDKGPTTDIEALKKEIAARNQILMTGRDGSKKLSRKEQDDLNAFDESERARLAALERANAPAGEVVQPDPTQGGLVNTDTSRAALKGDANAGAVIAKAAKASKEATGATRIDADAQAQRDSDAKIAGGEIVKSIFTSKTSEKAATPEEALSKMSDGDKLSILDDIRKDLKDKIEERKSALKEYSALPQKDREGSAQEDWVRQASADVRAGEAAAEMIHASRNADEPANARRDFNGEARPLGAKGKVDSDVNWDKVPDRNAVQTHKVGKTTYSVKVGEKAEVSEDGTALLKDVVNDPRVPKTTRWLARMMMKIAPRTMKGVKIVLINRPDLYSSEGKSYGFQIEKNGQSLLYINTAFKGSEPREVESHELVHTVTAQAIKFYLSNENSAILTPGQKLAIRNLKTIMETVKQQATGELNREAMASFGREWRASVKQMDNLVEFAAYSTTSPRFQNFLKKIRMGGEIKGFSVWRRTMDAFRRLIGMPGSTAADKAMENVLEIIRGTEQRGNFMRRGTGGRDFSAWHGSPRTLPPEPGYPHGRFSLEYVGTGEGGRMAGWGIYSAERESVGSGYRRSGELLLNGKPWNPDYAYGDRTPEKMILNLVENHVDRWNKLPEKSDITDSLWETHRQQLELGFSDMTRQTQDAIEWANKNFDKIGREEGSLYKLDIPDDIKDKMLDWDNPIDVTMAKRVASGLLFSEQAKKFSHLFIDGLAQPYIGLTGKKVYKDLESKLGSDKAASEWLANLGIPGNFHGGHSKGATGMKYVIWDQKVLDRISLLERNGKVLDQMRADDAQAEREMTVPDEAPITPEDIVKPEGMNPKATLTPSAKKFSDLSDSERVKFAEWRKAQQKLTGKPVGAGPKQVQEFMAGTVDKHKEAIVASGTPKTVGRVRAFVKSILEPANDPETLMHTIGLSDEYIRDFIAGTRGDAATTLAVDKLRALPEMAEIAKKADLHKSAPAPEGIQGKPLNWTVGHNVHLQILARSAFVEDKAVRTALMKNDFNGLMRAYGALGLDEKQSQEALKSAVVIAGKDANGTLVKKGGVPQFDINQMRRHVMDTDETSFHINAKSIMALYDGMPKEHKDWVEKYAKPVDDMVLKGLQSQYKALTGQDLPAFVVRYFASAREFDPGSVPEGMNQNIMKDRNNTVRALYLGNTKEINTRELSTRPMRIGNAADILQRHIDSSARYIGYAGMAKKWKKILNDNRSEIIDRRGSAAWEEMRRAIEDIEGTIDDTVTTVDRASNFFRGNVARAIMLSPFLWAYQPVSYMSAERHIPSQFLREALSFKGDKAEFQRVIDKVKSFAPDIELRFAQKSFEAELMPSSHGSAKAKAIAGTNSWRERWANALTRPVAHFDQITINRIMVASYLKTKSEMAETNPAFWQTVADLASRTVHSTQVSAQRGGMSGYRRKASQFWKMATFMSGGTSQSYNLIVRDAWDAKAANWKDPAKNSRFNRTVLSMAAQGAVIAMIQTVKAMALKKGAYADDDMTEEEKWGKIKQDMAWKTADSFMSMGPLSGMWLPALMGTVAKTLGADDQKRAYEFIEGRASLWGKIWEDVNSFQSAMSRLEDIERGYYLNKNGKPVRISDRHGAQRASERRLVKSAANIAEFFTGIGAGTMADFAYGLKAREDSRREKNAMQGMGI